jgi:hypothetical protein
VPIRAEFRALYPPDWRELSDRVRFGRAGGRCEACGQPHLHTVACLPDGRWCVLHTDRWFTRSGAPAAAPANAELLQLRWVRVVLTTAHLDHDPTNNADSNLAALCGRCHLAHDMPHHRMQRWLRWRLRWARADLFADAGRNSTGGD